MQVVFRASIFEVFFRGKKDPEFKKKPTLALELIDKSLNRGYRRPYSFNRFREMVTIHPF